MNQEGVFVISTAANQEMKDVMEDQNDSEYFTELETTVAELTTKVNRIERGNGLLQ